MKPLTVKLIVATLLVFAGLYAFFIYQIATAPVTIEAREEKEREVFATRMTELMRKEIRGCARKCYATGDHGVLNVFINEVVTPGTFFRMTPKKEELAYMGFTEMVIDGVRFAL